MLGVSVKKAAREKKRTPTGETIVQREEFKNMSLGESLAYVLIL